jgi:hypothetical protein
MDKDVQLVEVNPATPDPGRAKSLDVIFIHGLGGDHVETWKPPSGDSWPQRVANTHPDVQVWSLSYPAKVGELLSIGDMDQPGTRGLAVLATERMVTRKIGEERPCIFVCHSLGGLLAKRILLDAWSADQRNKRRFRHEGVKAVMFCGTPHRGSAIANVLNGMEWVKNIAPGLVMTYLGWDYSRYAGWFARRIGQTSELIKELEKNNVDLQHLNEDFGRYYQQRAGGDFMVTVYAETKAMKLKGVPTAVVVPFESANPNLRIGSSPPLPVLPVPDKDHSELVKPIIDSDWVVEGLDDLIQRIREGNLELGLDEGWQRRVGMLIHAELFKRPELLKLSYFRKLLMDKHEVAAEPFHVARQLAAVQGDAIFVLLGELAMVFDEVPRGDGLSDDMYDRLTRIGCILILAYMQADAARSPGADKVLEIEVPGIDDTQRFFIMVEVLHAGLRNWPVKLQVNKGQLVPASRVLGPAGQAPSSWRDPDHLHHLTNRILAPEVNEKSPTAMGGIDAEYWPEEQALPLGEVDEDTLLLARDRLDALLNYQLGVVLDTRDPSSPYASDEMRNRLGRAFGDVLTLILPVAEPTLDADTRRKLIKLQGHLQPFLVKAQNIQVKST